MRLNNALGRVFLASTLFIGALSLVLVGSVSAQAEVPQFSTNPNALPTPTGGTPATPELSLFDRIKSLEARKILDYTGDLKEKAKSNIEQKAMGVVYIGIGIILAFAGIRYFDLFIGTIGFVSFAAATLWGANTFLYKFSWTADPYSGISLIIVSILLGVAGALLCRKSWRFAIYLAAGFGGYALGTFAMSLVIIQDTVSRNVLLTATTVACIVATIFFEEKVIIVCSAISGALLILCGIDYFLRTGFVDIIHAAGMSGALPSGFSQLDRDVHLMMLGTVLVAVIGVLVQMFICKPRGYGRSD